MPRIVLHLGLHKTATKFLQRDVFPRIPGWRYVPKEAYERRLVDALANTDYCHFRERCAELRKLVIGDGGNDNILVSNELLSGNPFFRYADRHQCLLKLKDLFPEARIMLAIRGQREFIDSLYREYVIQGGVMTIDQFTAPGLPRGRSVLSRQPGLDLDSLRHGPYLEAIADRFGPDNLLVYPYETLAADFPGFLRRIGEFLEADLAGCEFRTERHHASLRNCCLSGIRTVNRCYYSAFHHAGFMPHRWNPGRSLARFGPARLKRSARSCPYLPASLPDYASDNTAIDLKYSLSLREKYASSYFPET